MQTEPETGPEHAETIEDTIRDLRIAIAERDLRLLQSDRALAIAHSRIERLEKDLDNVTTRARIASSDQPQPAQQRPQQQSQPQRKSQVRIRISQMDGNLPQSPSVVLIPNPALPLAVPPLKGPLPLLPPNQQQTTISRKRPLINMHYIPTPENERPRPFISNLEGSPIPTPARGPRTSHPAASTTYSPSYGGTIPHHRSTTSMLSNPPRRPSLSAFSTTAATPSPQQAHFAVSHVTAPQNFALPASSSDRTHTQQGHLLHGALQANSPQPAVLAPASGPAVSTPTIAHKIHTVSATSTEEGHEGEQEEEGPDPNARGLHGAVGGALQMRAYTSRVSDEATWVADVRASGATASAVVPAAVARDSMQLNNGAPKIDASRGFSVQVGAPALVAVAQPLVAEAMQVDVFLPAAAETAGPESASVAVSQEPPQLMGKGKRRAPPIRDETDDEDDDEEEVDALRQGVGGIQSLSRLVQLEERAAMASKATSPTAGYTGKRPTGSFGGKGLGSFGRKGLVGRYGDKGPVVGNTIEVGGGPSGSVSSVFTGKGSTFRSPKRQKQLQKSNPSLQNDSGSSSLQQQNPPNENFLDILAVTCPEIQVQQHLLFMKLPPDTLFSGEPNTQKCRPWTQIMIAHDGSFNVKKHHTPEDFHACKQIKLIHVKLRNRPIVAIPEVVQREFVAWMLLREMERRTEQGPRRAEDVDDSAAVSTRIDTIKRLKVPSPLPAPPADARAEDLEQMLVVEDDAFAWPCALKGCGAVFPSKTLLRKHMRDNAPNHPQHVCEVESCMNAYWTREECDAHEAEDVHTVFMSPCGKHFCTVRDYLEHMDECARCAEEVGESDCELEWRKRKVKGQGQGKGKSKEKESRALNFEEEREGLKGVEKKKRQGSEASTRLPFTGLTPAEQQAIKRPTHLQLSVSVPLQLPSAQKNLDAFDDLDASSSDEDDEEEHDDNGGGSKSQSQRGGTAPPVEQHGTIPLSSPDVSLATFPAHFPILSLQFKPSSDNDAIERNLLARPQYNATTGNKMLGTQSTTRTEPAISAVAPTVAVVRAPENPADGVFMAEMPLLVESLGEDVEVIFGRIMPWFAELDSVLKNPIMDAARTVLENILDETDMAPEEWISNGSMRIPVCYVEYFKDWAVEELTRIFPNIDANFPITSD
ncbi:hypothetical protein BC830DRAFT_1214663 [Chytriomyces sp. MP71]|nr:hypothetical protein BC830DRAFT_1214663 [Chytriomyces sp. MP71]